MAPTFLLFPDCDRPGTDDTSIHSGIQATVSPDSIIYGSNSSVMSSVECRHDPALESCAEQNNMTSQTVKEKRSLNIMPVNEPINFCRCGILPTVTSKWQTSFKSCQTHTIWLVISASSVFVSLLKSATQRSNLIEQPMDLHYEQRISSKSFKFSTLVYYLVTVYCRGNSVNFLLPFPAPSSDHREC